MSIKLPQRDEEKSQNIKESKFSNENENGPNSERQFEKVKVSSTLEENKSYL